MTVVPAAGRDPGLARVPGRSVSSGQAKASLVGRYDNNCRLPHFSSASSRRSSAAGSIISAFREKLVPNSLQG
jgi:hypothetical protein